MSSGPDWDALIAAEEAAQAAASAARQSATTPEARQAAIQAWSAAHASVGVTPQQSPGMHHVPGRTYYVVVSGQEFTLAHH